jgi:hypothetical protein
MLAEEPGHFVPAHVCEIAVIVEAGRIDADEDWHPLSPPAAFPHPQRRSIMGRRQGKIVSLSAAFIPGMLTVVGSMTLSGSVLGTGRQ